MSNNSKVTTIDILRHGKTEGGEIFRGYTDVALSIEGREQMHNALQNLSGWQHIVSSPMQRCLSFSEEFASKYALTQSAVKDLREISFGDWDGKTFTEVWGNNATLFNNFWRDPINNTPPNAEAMNDFCHRVKQAFWQTVEQQQGRHILMVVHGGVVRALLSEVLQSAMVSLMRYEVPYACVTRVKIYHDNNNHWPQLVFHNLNANEVEMKHEAR
jgi:broad specificity phosphatase PhoE